MDFKIGSKTYSLEYIEKTLGQPNFTEYTLDELLKLTKVKLREILREKKEIKNIPTKWRKGEVIIAILYAHKGKCNHIRTNGNGDFVGFCKRKPTGENGGNGRCDLMGGKKPKGSTSKRKDPGTTRDMTKNNHALSNGLYRKDCKIPKEQQEILQEIKDNDELELMKEEYRFLISMLRQIRYNVGLEYMNEDEQTTEYTKEEEFEESYDKQVTKIKTKSKRKKTSTMENYLAIYDRVIKLGDSIKKIEKDFSQEVEQDFDYIPIRYRDSKGDTNE